MNGDRIERTHLPDEIRETNDRLRLVLSMLVHDLENPLNVAQGRLQLARETGDARHFDSLEVVLERMEQILEDSRYILEGRDFDVVSVSLSSAAARAWEHIDSKNAILEYDLEDEKTIRVDEGALLHVLENLFSNAVEHGSSGVAGDEETDAGVVDGPPTVTRLDTTARSGTEGITVRIGTFDEGFYVEDTGVGIPVDRRAIVFESGYSVDESGSGLGLSIVREIVRAHGWTIRVTTGREGGTRFEIRTGVD